MPDARKGEFPVDDDLPAPGIPGRVEDASYVVDFEVCHRGRQRAETIP